MNKLEVKNNYIDVTKEWLKNATPNSHKVKEQLYFDYNGKRYNVDNKNVVLDYSKEELEIAHWLKNTFGGEIYLLPRINIPKGIMTSDFLFKNEKYDLKEINGLSKRVIDNAIKNKKYQANNFIFKINESLSEEDIISQVLRVYKTYHREWVNVIIIVKDYKLLKVFKRKK